MKNAPDHHDAELVLRLYDLRREPVMRESRNALNATFWPKSWDDVVALTKPDHPMNAAWRQTSSYWEMAYGMARHGIVNAEYFVESNGEGLLLYAKILPWLPNLREMSPFAFSNAEWIAESTERGRALVGLFRKRIEATTASKG